MCGIGFQLETTPETRDEEDGPTQNAYIFAMGALVFAGIFDIALAVLRDDEEHLSNIRNLCEEDDEDGFPTYLYANLNIEYKPLNASFKQV